MSRKWIPTTNYFAAYVDGKHLVMKQGGKYVLDYITPENSVLTVVATAADYDAAVAIVKALRAELEAETS